MSEREREEAIRTEIDLIEKEIVYFRGKRRLNARRKYFCLLRLCGEDCSLNEPIYLNRK